MALGSNSRQQSVDSFLLKHVLIVIIIMLIETLIIFIRIKQLPYYTKRLTFCNKRFRPIRGIFCFNVIIIFQTQSFSCDWPSHALSQVLSLTGDDSVEIPSRCSFVIEFIIPKFIEGSTCFERHTAHHREL
jgi:hypothetical protein